MRKPKLPHNTEIVWQPDSLPGEPLKQGKQYEFLSASTDYCGIDGGKGSGKSDLLIFDCLKPWKLNNPRWHGVIFRREYKRLTELIDRATYWLNRLPSLGAHWQGKENRFVFPSGAWLAFHNCEHPGDEEKYQGWEITDLKFDQLEEFERQMFYYLCLQNRPATAGRFPNVRWTANPIGVGAGWLKKDWIKDKPTGVIHKKTIELPDGTKKTLTYKRIHATVFDNPLLRHDTTYIAKLMSDPDPYRRKALFEGDWDTVVGQFFSTYSSKVHVIPSRELPRSWRRLAGLDYGNVKTMEFLARDYQGTVYIEWEYRSEPTDFNPSGDVASQFGEKSAKFMLEREIGEDLLVVGDVNMWSAVGRDVGTDKTPAKIVQQIWNERFEAKGLKPPRLVRVHKSGDETYHYRIACNEAVRDFLHYEQDPVTGKFIREPRIFILDRCASIQETLPALVADPNDPMDIADGQDDHDYDALKMPFYRLLKTKAEPKQLTAKEKWERQRIIEHQEQPADWRTDWMD